MRSTITLLLLTLCCMTGLTGYAQKQALNITYITNEDGLPHNYVSSISEDQQGFIWVSTASGVVRLDGTNIREFNDDITDINSLKGGATTATMVGKDGKIWIGTASAGLNIYDPSQHLFRHITKDSTSTAISLKGNNIHKILEDTHGNIWLGTRNLGIAKVNNEMTHIEYFGKGSTSSLKMVKNGDIYACIKKQMRVFRDGRELELKFNIPRQNFPAIEEIRDGVLWLGGWGTGIVEYDVKKSKELRRILPQQNKGLTTNSIFRILKDKQGRVWIGTWGSGLFLYDVKKDRFSPIDLVEPNSGHEKSDYAVITELKEDKYGNIWVGTSSSGICKINAYQKAFHSEKHIMGEENGLKRGLIAAVYEDSRENVWLGIINHGLIYKKGENFHTIPMKKYRTAITRSGVIANSIQEDSKGDIWFTHTDGISKLLHNNKIEDCEIVNYDYRQGRQGTVLFKDSKNVIWIGTKHQGLHKILSYNDKQQILNTRTYKYANKPDSLQSAWITSIYEDANHNFWVGTFGGLHLFDREQNKFTFFKAKGEGALSNNSIMSITGTSDGHIWVGTAKGLNEVILHDDNTLEVLNIYQKNNGLPSNYISAVLTDNKDNIWVSSNNGLAKLTPNTKKVEVYGKHEGVYSKLFMQNVAFKHKSGKMYFGAKNSYTVFHPNEINLKASVITPRIIDLNVDNQAVLPRDKIKGNQLLTNSIEHTDEITFSYRHNSITFGFVGMGAGSSHKWEYAYKMDGLDDEWHYVGTKREATYTSLPREKEMTFRVKVSAGNNLWSEAKTIKVYVMPPWWETTTFRLIVLVLVIVLAFVGYKYRTYQLKKKQIELQRIVDEKTIEVRTQNEELFQQSEELAQQRDHLFEANKEITNKNELITASLNYATTIQKAILPTDEQWKQNYKDHFVIFQPKDIVSGDFYWMAEDDNKIFLACVDCTGHGVPGAFMSMIGNSILNQIVKERKIYSPKIILTELDRRVRQVLKQEKGQNDDGMDLSFCVLENQGSKVKVTFSGAKNNLYYHSKGDNKLSILKGSRKAIGGITKSDKAFIEEVIFLKKGDYIYLFTDGILDVCNRERKRFGKTRVLSLLEEHLDKDMHTQQEIITETFTKYQGSAEQRDDITVLGVVV